MLSSTQSKVLSQMGRNPKTAREIGKAARLQNGRLYSTLNALANAGMIQKSSFESATAGKHSIDSETRYGWILSREVD